MSAIIETAKRILAELNQNLDSVDERQVEKFADAILSAKHIYLAGSGRSGLMIRAFANRLMHLGLSVSVVGDITTSFAGKGDLLIIGSGSGETLSLVAMAQKAKKQGVAIALNTGSSLSMLAKLADVTFVMPNASQKVEQEKARVLSIQPMGSGYEQLSLIIYDAVIIHLMKKLQKSSDDMFAFHANLE